MRKNIVMIISTLSFCGLMTFSGCSSKNATDGTVTITIVDYKTNLPIPNELVYISSSYENLKNHVWLDSKYTDGTGRVSYRLTPILVYYDTEHWENYGATQVYAGTDESVILYVNNTFPKK
jgi:hypothetical protein